MSSWVSSDISFNASVTKAPHIGAAQGEAGLKGEGIMVWSTAKGDLELRVKVRKGMVPAADKEPRCLAASVPELSLRSPTEMPWKGFQRAGCLPALLALLSPETAALPVLTLAAWPYLCPSHQPDQQLCAQKQVCRPVSSVAAPVASRVSAPQVVRGRDFRHRLANLPFLIRIPHRQPALGKGRR